jgi:hypothetical protein
MPGRITHIEPAPAGETTFQVRVPWWKQRAKRTLPPVSTVAKNAVKAAGRAAGRLLVGGRVIATEDIAAARVEVCHSNTCGQYLPDRRRCVACGCFVATKASMLTEDCPLRFWPELPAEMPRPVQPRKPCGSCKQRMKAKRRFMGSKVDKRRQGWM